MIHYNPARRPADSKTNPLMFVIGGAFVASMALLAYKYAKSKEPKKIEEAPRRERVPAAKAYSMVDKNPIESIQSVTFESSAANDRKYDDTKLKIFSLYVYPLAITQDRILAMYVSRDAYSTLNDIYKQRKRVPFAPYLGLSTSYPNSDTKMETSFASLEGITTKTTMEFLEKLINDNAENVKLIYKTYLSNETFEDEMYNNEEDLPEVISSLKNAFGFHGMNRLAVLLQTVEKLADKYWKQRRDSILKTQPALKDGVKGFVNDFDKQRLFAATLWLVIQRISKIIYKKQLLKQIDKNYDDQTLRSALTAVLKDLNKELGFDPNTYPKDMTTDHQSYVWFVSAFFDGAFNLEVPYYDRIGFDFTDNSFPQTVYYTDPNSKNKIVLTTEGELDTFYEDAAFLAGAIFWSTSTVRDIKNKKIPLKKVSLN